MSKSYPAKKGSSSAPANPESASQKSPATTADSSAQPGRKPGLLSLAFEVLANSDQALSTQDMVARVMSSGKWSTSGKTPQATLYAAIIREIAEKGSESRFVKTARGRFAARPA